MSGTNNKRGGSGTGKPHPPKKSKTKGRTFESARAKLGSHLGLVNTCFLDTRLSVAFPAFELLSLLGAYPVLATEEFKDANGTKRMPLSFFLKAQCQLKIIKEVCELAYEFHKTQGPKFRGVFDAIQFGSKDGVLDFLLQEFPLGAEGTFTNNARTIAMDKDLTPLQALLYGGVSVSRSAHETFECAELLLTAFPDAILKKDFMGKSIMTVALQTGFDDRILQMVFSKYADLDGKKDSFTIGERAFICLDSAKALSKILPGLKRLFLKAPYFTKEGLLHLLRQLETNKSIQILLVDLDTVVDDLHNYSRYCGEIASAFQRICARNSTLLRIRFGRTIGKHYQPFAGGADNVLVTIQAVASAKNSSIERLDLCDLPLFGSPTAFSSLLSNCQIPHVSIESCTFDNVWESVKLNPKCMVENLTVHNCSLDSSLGAGIVSQLGEFPALTSLSLSHKNARMSPAAMPVSLKALLDRHQLSELFLFNVDLEFDHFESFLKTDKAMGTFCFVCNEESKEEVTNVLFRSLENRNVTLSFVQTDFHNTGCESEVTELVSKSDYYVALNCYGRSAARNLSTSKQEFVGLLCRVARTKEIWCPEAKDATFKHSILFGLLQCAPGVWSTSSAKTY